MGKKTLLCFGFGYCAKALAPHLLAENWSIIGTTRKAEKAIQMKSQGIKATIWPGSDVETALQQATHLLISPAPTENGDVVLNQLDRELGQHKDHLEWVGYLSTTGVYGDRQGGWVNEDSQLIPTTQRGILRVAAEKEWRATGLPLHIFRLAGIYGPGRGPFSKLQNGTARRIIKKDQVFSRIHIDDIIQVLLASIAKPNPGGIYNLCDDDPAPPQDVIAYAAQLLQLPIPSPENFDSAEMTPIARSFYSESKRVKNDRIKLEFGVQLKHPNFRNGLSADHRKSQIEQLD